MKSLALLALLGWATAQTVWYSNCCQGLLCGQKDDCPPCGTHSDDGRSCCEEGEATPQSEDASSCVHLEPSSEVLIEDVAPAALDVVALELLADVFVASSSGSAPVRPPCGSDPPRPRDPDLPLFLRDQALLIYA